MAYDEELAKRVKTMIGNTAGFVEKKMFGGVGYLIHGNMACGVNGDRLIVRLEPQEYEMALGKPFVSIFDMTGRPMKGWVTVAPEGLRTQTELKAWVEQGVAFAQTLPHK